MRKLALFFLLGVNSYGSPVKADDAPSDLVQANNPIANIKAFNIQNYYYSNLSYFNTSGDTVWLRYAQPFHKFLVRASMPLQNFPTNSSHPTGTGDFNIFAAYLYNTGNPAVSFRFRSFTCCSDSKSECFRKR